MRRVLSAQEAERRRIAQELHDQIGQNLTAVVLELKRLQGSVDRRTGARRSADAQELAREILEELRRISYELRPAVLDDLGLASALASLCRRRSRGGRGSRSTHEVDGPLPALDARRRARVYRIAQEALTNAVRHSGCTRVRVAAALDRRDGPGTCGCTTTAAGVGGQPRSGGGIRGMRERAVMIGGRLTCSASPTTAASRSSSASRRRTPDGVGC